MRALGKWIYRITINPTLNKRRGPQHALEIPQPCSRPDSTRPTPQKNSLRVSGSGTVHLEL